MRPGFQSKQQVVINAPIEEVWTFNQDLAKISDYHPRVDQVSLISDKQFREAGVMYQCHLSDGKNTCIEKDIEIVPMKTIVTIFPSDTMGLSKLLPDYTVETNFTSMEEAQTKMEISHYYSISNWKVWLLNIYIKRKIAKETQETLNAIKNAIEQAR
jgi:hypothetical protein